MRLTGWFARFAGLALLCLSLSCGDSVGPRVPANIVIVPNQPVVPQGLTLALTATVVDAAGRAIGGMVVTFTSSDPLTATVSAAGVVTSLGPLGTVRITGATAGISSFVDLLVQQRAVGIQVVPESLTINPATSDTLAVTVVDFLGAPLAVPGSLSFASSDSALVTVTSHGVVTAPGPARGHATVTITADSIVVLVPVNVAQIPGSLFVSATDVVMRPSTSQQLRTAVLDVVGDSIAGAAISITNNSPSLFTVSGTGLVSASSNTGSGSLTVRAGSLTKTVTVFVSKAVVGIRLKQVLTPDQPYAAAVSGTGQVLVSLATAGIVLRGDLPSFQLSPITTGGAQLGVAINPAGSRGYLALTGLGSAGVVDMGTNSLLTPLSGIFGTVYSVAVSNDGQFVFVGTEAQVLKYDAATGNKLDSVGVAALHLAIHPTLSLIYASDPSGGTFEINSVTMTTVRTFSGTARPQAVAVAPDGSELYVANEGTDVLAFDLSTGLAAGSFTTRLGSVGLAVSDSQLVVTENIGNQIEIFDRVSRVATGFLTTGGHPRRPAFAPGGNLVVVPNEDGWVDFIR